MKILYDNNTVQTPDVSVNIEQNVDLNINNNDEHPSGDNVEIIGVGVSGSANVVTNSFSLHNSIAEECIVNNNSAPENVLIEKEIISDT